MSTRFPGFALLIALAGFFLLSCSFSHSSKSSSNSSRGSSRSSGSSSGSSSPSSLDGSAYQRDVRDYTASYAKSGGASESFRRDLGGIAEDHGVTDWERDQETYTGIGGGLQKAGVAGMQLEQYKLDLANSNPQYMAWIKSGYDEQASR